MAACKIYDLICPRLPPCRRGRDSGGDGRRLRQGNRCQACGRRRDPLVNGVGKAVIEIWLESRGARTHVPGPIRQLSAQQILNASLVSRVGNRQTRARKRHHRQTGGERAALHRGNIGPPSIGALRRQQITLSLHNRAFAAPNQTLQAPRRSSMRNPFLRASAPANAARLSLWHEKHPVFGMKRPPR